ncbi:RNA-binding protein YlmH [Salirhabdus euzebyi]|uniref:RNA-binding protein YlmH n=1 Tax=Salirhabdus euzebyi TaxID=394506 RepID=A0A841Q9H7_9BACI|nr:RNA-binding protein [Salirhabdus euzebyi]MBB6455046.1 RNA-binding protein YlmH [Salirhabdus euzebyi]
MDIYQHFRVEEQPFIDKVLSWKEEVERMFVAKLTDFLDPREQHIVNSLIGNNGDIQVHFFGGSSTSERKRAIIAPLYEQIDKQNFNICLLEGKFPNKFVTLEHRDVLGALMSLGIKRKKMGDILVGDGIVHLLVDQEVSTYVQMHLTGIKKASISLVETAISNLVPSTDQWIEQEGTVSSLRLDAIIKEIYNVSRKQAADYISKGAVKVNFREVENSAFSIEQGDIISIRKKGRSKVVRIEGKTKKEKWRITTAKLK